MNQERPSKDNPYPAFQAGWRDVMGLCTRYWMRRPQLLSGLILLTFCLVAADILMPVAAGMLVDRAVIAANGDGSFAAAWQALFLFAGASIAHGIINHATHVTWIHMAAPNMSSLLQDTFRKVQRFSADWHANTFAGATVRKVTRGKWSYDAISDIVWIHFLPLILIVSGLTIILCQKFLEVGLLFLATVIIYVGISVVLALKYLRPANIRAAAADSAIGANIADAITNNATVKAFGAEEREEVRFQGTSDDWANKALVSWTRGGQLKFLQSILWAVLQLVTIGVVLSLAAQGRASAGDIAFLLTANFQLGGHLRQVGNHIRQFQRASSELADVVDFHWRPEQIADPQQASPFEAKRGEIVFDRVNFGYSSTTQPLYQDFSLTIRPNERVGLVGPSGSGKSTFVKLIQRLYDVDSGEIRLDGQPVREVNQSSLRASVALVPQDPLLFHRSLAENIAYGRPDATEEEIIEAAKRARAWEFIQRLPYGLDTLVGERGIKLSGGERQRVAIARAFVADAPVVIFDEATSSLDTITERLIQDAMNELMDGRTTIIIAHRLSTVRDVDRILVFDHGRIVEQGSHAELMSLGQGRYRSLYEMQDVAA
ncbi:MAG: ABC transporter ATP-binding protein [Parvularculaceae bacterium]|nr:ABC transporter ATP-binding protein [Parvularculaceae bacterium]